MSNFNSSSVFGVGGSFIVKTCSEKTEIELSQENIMHAQFYKKMCYNNNIMEEKDMSFVGFVVCKNGDVVGFADRKTTLDNEEDLKRGNVRKIFVNNDIIVLTHGFNTIVGLKNITYIEDFLHEIVEVSYSNLSSFLRKLREKFEEEIDTRLFEFNVYDIGTKSFYDIKIENLNISVKKNNISCYVCNNGIGTWTVSGDNTFVSKFNIKSWKNLDVALTASTYFIDNFKKDFSILVKLLNQTPFYNSVNDMFDFVTVPFKNNKDNSLVVKHFHDEKIRENILSDV